MKNDKYTSLENRLSNLDFSEQSLVRDAVRLELDQRISAKPVAGNTDSLQPQKWNMFRNPMPAFALGFIIALAGFSVAHPDTRDVLMKSFIKVGKSTFIISGGKTDSTADEYFRKRGEEDMEAGTMFRLVSIYGGYGCGIPEGADPFMKQTPSLRIAAGLMDRPLIVPTYFHENIPADFQFRKAEILPDNSVALTFGLGRYETRLMQISVGTSNTVSYSTSTTETKPDGTTVTIYLTPQIEELTIGGSTVIWQIHDEGMRTRLGTWAQKNTDTDIGKFYWEEGGQSFTLDGRFLTKEEGIKIIRSLEPYQHK